MVKNHVSNKKSFNYHMLSLSVIRYLGVGIISKHKTRYW
jgi:hypothetical protein